MIEKNGCCLYFNLVPKFSTLPNHFLLRVSFEVFIAPKYDTVTGFTPQNPNVDFLS
jgi:hypothetical protein